MTLRQIICLCGLTLLPLCSLICQQEPAKPRSSAPQSSSGSTLDLRFGPTFSNAEGKAAAERLLRALGGPATVNAVKSLRQSVVALQQGQRIEVDQSIVYPDKQAQKVITPQGKMLLVITPSDAFMAVGGQVQNLRYVQRTSLDSAMKHDPVNVLQHINDPKYIFTATGQESLDGAEATVVDVEADGVPTRWWIGADGRLLRERSSGEGGKIQTMVYSEWKNFGGLRYPTKYEVYSEGGKPVLSMTLTTMEVNPVVSPKLFQRPSTN